MSDLDLPVPFQPVTDAQMVFGGIPNMEEAVANCPKEFFLGSMRGFDLLAEDLFAHYAGWRSMTPEQINEMKSVTDMSKYSDEKWRYIQTWLKSFAPKHEQKSAVVAWCLSQILMEPPPYTLR